MTKHLPSFFAATVLAASCLLAPLSANAQAASAAAPVVAVPAAATPEVTAPAAVPVAAPAVTKETVDNPYGLSALWAQGDFVAKGVLVLLVLMSMGSWYIMITKLYESMKISGEAKAARKGFFKSSSLNEAVKTLKEGSAFRFIAESGINAGDHH